MDFQLEEVSLELTNRCGRSCLHCSSGSELKALPDELTYDEHLRIIMEARELGATVLSLSGGEPLMCGYLVDLVTAAEVLSFDRILIYTTGLTDGGDYIWDYDGIDSLLLRNITWIFSLHSHVPEVHDYIMNFPGSHHQICESMAWLVDRGQDVEIHMVPMAPNYKHIAGMRQLCNSLKIKKLSLLRFVPQTRGEDNIHELGITKKQFAEMQFLLHQAKKENENGGVEVRMGCPIDFRHAVGLLDSKAKPCHAGDDLILVRPDGDIHPCAAWKSLPGDDNYRVIAQMLQKNANVDPLEYIWKHSESFNLIRRFKYCLIDNEMAYAIQPYYIVAGGPCRMCTHSDSCMTGCLAQRLHAYGRDMKALFCDASDPLCPRGDDWREDEFKSQ